MVWGQTAGSVTGTVHDNTGAVVAGAEVTVSNAANGFKATATTNSDGSYLVPGVPAGSYDVTITAKGFKEFHVKDLVVRVTQKVRVDATLEVGKVDVEVVVEGAAVAQVETQSSELAGTVTGKEISQLQLNGRNFTQLVTLVGGHYGQRRLQHQRRPHRVQQLGA
jgi:hypothetical protein